MSEPVQALQTMSRKQLIDELLRRGYYGPAVTRAASMILTGAFSNAEILATLEPDFARAHSTRAWLDNGPVLSLETVGEIAEHGETLPPRHAFEDQLRDLHLAAAVNADVCSVCEGFESDHTSCANAVQHFLRLSETERDEAQ